MVLPGGTTHDLSCEEILRNAYDLELVEIVVTGVDAAGVEYVLRTNADRAAAMYHLQRGIHRLNKEVDETGEDH